MATLHLTPDDLKADMVNEWASRDDVRVMLSLSAYDVPRSVTVQQNEAAKTLKIDFQYVDQEEPVAHEVGGDLTVLVGKNSGKVLGFLVRGTTWPDNVKVRIVEGVERQLQRATRPNQRMNYRLIQNVVDRKLDALLTSAF